MRRLLTLRLVPSIPAIKSSVQKLTTGDYLALLIARSDARVPPIVRFTAHFRHGLVAYRARTYDGSMFDLVDDAHLTKMILVVCDRPPPDAQLARLQLSTRTRVRVHQHSANRVLLYAEFDDPF